MTNQEALDLLRANVRQLNGTADAHDLLGAAADVLQALIDLTGQKGIGDMKENADD